MSRRVHGALLVRDPQDLVTPGICDSDAAVLQPDDSDADVWEKEAWTLTRFLVLVHRVHVPRA